MLSLIWLEPALAELEATLDYIAERNQSAADRLQADIEACVERLPEHPFLYRTGRVPGTREAVVHPNYILVYRVGVTTIEIVGVLHARRQYP